MKHLEIITKREYLNKVRNKSFVIMTFVTPIIVVIFSVLVGYLINVNNMSNVKKISVLDETGLFSSSFESSQTIAFHILPKMSLNEAKAQVLSENQYALLHISPTENGNWRENIHFFSEESPNIQLISQISSDIEKTLFQNNLTKRGIDKSQIDASKIDVSVLVENFSGEKSSQYDNFLRVALGGAAGYLLFMFIIIYGNSIMRSVIEEKTNRIVEIIISSVKPFTLLLGKIFGTSLAGLTQFLIWMIFGGLLMTILTSFLDISPSQSNEIILTKTGTDKMISEVLVAFFRFPFLEMFFSFLLFFIGGCLLYSSLYATIGAMVDSETDTQQFMMPIITPLIVAFYVGMFSVIEEPHGTVAVVFSYIPLTSPVVMLMRIPFGVTWWEVLISLLVLYISFLIVIKIASKIYRIGILMYGKKPSYKDIWKWFRY